MVPRSSASAPLPPLWGGAWCPHIFFSSRAHYATLSPPLPPSSRLGGCPLRFGARGIRPDSSACPLPLPAGAFISFRSAKIPIPAPSPATLPPPAPGGGIESHHSHRKTPIVRPPCPDNLRPIFFPPRCRSSARLAPSSQAGRRTASWSVYGLRLPFRCNS